MKKYIYKYKYEHLLWCCVLTSQERAHINIYHEHTPSHKGKPTVPVSIDEIYMVSEIEISHAFVAKIWIHYASENSLESQELIEYPFNELLIES